eukprot:2446829-Amphidinium_carterae.1
MSPKNLLDVDENAVDALAIPFLSDALKTLGECERQPSGLTANKIPPSASASAAAAAEPAVRTLRPVKHKVKKKTMKKGKGNIVKLDTDALSAIDEVAENISSFQSFEEDEEEAEEEEKADEVFDRLSSTPADNAHTPPNASTPEQPR